MKQTFGWNPMPRDQRVFMQFARAVLEQKDIILHTDGSSMGNYVDIDDL